MGDGKASVRAAFRDDPLRPQVHGQMRPVVIPCNQLIPACFAFLLPGPVLRYQTPEGGEVDDDAVVEIGIPERRNPGHFVTEGLEFLDKTFLSGDVIALTGGGIGAALNSPLVELALLVLELGRDVIVQYPIESVAIEAVIVEPD